MTPHTTPSPGDRETIARTEEMAERLNRLAKDAWVGSVEEWTCQAVLAMAAGARFIGGEVPPLLADNAALRAKVETAEARATTWEEAYHTELSKYAEAEAANYGYVETIARLTAELAQAKAQVAGMTERIEALKPSDERPCDCRRCDCGNVGNAEAVAAWDQHAAIYAALATLQEQSDGK